MCLVPTPQGLMSLAAYGRRSIMAPPWFMSRQNRIHGSANQNCWRSEPYRMSFQSVHSGRV